MTVTKTETVTDVVERKVPVWTNECSAYVDLVDSTQQEIVAYEDGIAPQQQILYDTLAAIIEKDTNGLNAAITAQQTLQNKTTGPLQRIMESQPKLAEARTDCLGTLEARNE